MHRTSALYSYRPALWLSLGMLMAGCQQLPMATGAESPQTHSQAAIPASGRSPEPPRTLPTGAAVAATIAPPVAVAERDSPLVPPADLWQRLQRGLRISEPGGASGDLVAGHEAWYRRNPEHLRRTFTRARLYLHDIVEAVERDNMPMEIALLPAVESAFLPEARSYAAAVGLWQFIAPTGRRFDLKQHLFRDDRRAVREATQAALRYLSELQQRYGGDYQLALAAYNCGEGCIDKAVQRARSQGLRGRFEDLRLNEQTANYVPRLLALARVVRQAVDNNDLAAVGLPPMANAPYFEAVPIERDIDVRLAAELAGLRLADFRALNPQHKRPLIVAAGGEEVLVPVEAAARLREALQRHRGPMASWEAIRVSQRSRVDALARQHGIAPQVLQEVNQIPHGHLVSAGSTLLVPRGQADLDVPEAVINTARLNTEPAVVRHSLALRKRDSLTTVATRLGVTASQLKTWNPGLALPRKGPLVVQLPVDVAERLARARARQVRAAPKVPVHSAQTGALHKQSGRPATRS